MQPNLSELSNIVTNEPLRPKFKPLCENIFDVSRSELFEVLDSLQNAFWSDKPILTTIPDEHDQYYQQQQQQQQTPSMIGAKRYSFQGNSNDFNDSKRLRAENSPSPVNQIMISPEEYEQQPMSPSPPPSPPGPTSPVHYTEMIKDDLNSKIQSSALSSLLSSSNGHLYNNNNNSNKKEKLWQIKFQLFKELKFNPQDYNESRILAIWQDCRQCRTKMEIQHLAKFLLPVALCMRRLKVANIFQQVLD